MASKLQQGWKFFEIRPNFARKLVDVQAQLVKDLSGIVTTSIFFLLLTSIYFFLETTVPAFRSTTLQFTTSAWAMIYRARHETWTCSGGHGNRGYYLSSCPTCGVARDC